MSSDQQGSSQMQHQQETTKEDATSSSPTDDTSKQLADCLLSQYRFCTAGIGLGTAYAVKYKKGFIPMIAAGAIGTTADMVYGYLVECLEFRQEQQENEK